MLTIRDIDTNSVSGKLLFAALCRLTVLVDTDKTPDGCLALLQEKLDEQFGPTWGITMAVREPFEKELTQLINRHSIENGSNTPDFILARYLNDCLLAFQEASRAREKWYGKSLSINGVDSLKDPEDCPRLFQPE